MSVSARHTMGVMVWGIGGMLALSLGGCQQEEPAGSVPDSATHQETRAAKPETRSEEGGETMALRLQSSAFGPNQPIPQDYTGDGKDRSPPLSWSGVPAGTKELALICDDPDAPIDEPFVHWVLYKIPPETSELPEGIPDSPSLQSPEGAYQGQNHFDRTGYGGPAPPKGHGVHHYHFKLYALDQPLDLEPGASKATLLEAIEGHILEQAELIGTYER